MASRNTGHSIPAGLEESIAGAVAESLAAAASVRGPVSDLLASLAVAHEPHAGPPADPRLERVLAAERQECATAARELDGLLSRLNDLGTFKIAVLGKTGTGKSTLIEALTRGDGSGISPGQGDYTRDVRRRWWDEARCHVYDAPGIMGWGHGDDPARLEELARSAVEQADVVLLCFGNTGMQEEEFSRAARWIRDYGKPAVAVLNCFDRQWRMPVVTSHQMQEPSREYRERICRQVAERAGLISAQLVKAGLAGVPIVAISAKLAVLARARAPYNGPFRKEAARYRQLFTAGELQARSHLPRLTWLLQTALVADATRLRLGGMYEHAHAVLAAADRRLHAEVRVPAAELLEAAEREIEQILTLVNVPSETADGGRTKTTHTQLQARLRQLETVRGGPFDVPAAGTVWRHTDNVIAAGLAEPRAAMLRRAEAMVDAAVLDRRKLTSEQFVAQVYEPGTDELARAKAQIHQDLTAYLQARLAAQQRVTGLEQAGLRRPTASVAGNAGRFLAGLETGLQVSTLISQVAAMIDGGFSGTLVSLAAKFGGRKAGEKAEAKHIDAHARGRADAARAVTSAFDELHRTLAATVAERIRREALTTLVPAIDRALLLHEIVRATDDRRARLAETARALPDIGSSAAVLRNAASSCERAAGVRTRQEASRLWLGASDWDTGEPGPPETGTTPAGRRHRRTRMTLARLLWWLQGVLARRTAWPRRRSGRRWLARARRRLKRDPHARQMLADLADLAKEGRARIVVCGDTNTGKSALVRRLLIDAGGDPPPGLRVSSTPETMQPAEYRYKGLLLVDTPGLRSGRPEHTDLTVAALRDAAAVLVLFDQHLLVGQHDELRQILAGGLGREPFTGHLLFVINQIDGLILDPEAQPEEFATLIASKKEELCQALATIVPTRGTVAFDPASVFAVAADPPGLRDAAPHDRRDWDGMTELAEALDQIRPGMAASGLDLVLLRGGRARLTELISTAERQAAGLRGRLDRLDGLAAEVLRSAEEGRTLLEAARDRLHDRADGFARELYFAALRGGSSGSRTALTRRVLGWPADQEFKQHLERWQDELTAQTNAWRRSSLATVRRHLETPVPHQTTTGTVVATVPLDLDFLTAADRKADRTLLLYGLGKAAEAASALDAANLQKLAANIGLSLSAGDADHLTHVLDDAAFGLGLLSMWQTGSSLLGRGRLQIRAAQRADGLRKVQESAAVFVRKFTDEQDPATPLGELAAGCTRLRSFARQVTDERQRVSAGLAATRARIETYRRLHAEAADLLTPPPERRR